MKIAIDVTPTLPGGENGGIKQLLWELLRWFCNKDKSNKFVLLTSFKNHHIFKEFERFKAKRICVLNDPSAVQKFSQWQIYRILDKKFNKYNNKDILRKNKVSVLFCPFSAPTFTEPGIPTVSIIADLQHIYYPFFFSKQQLKNRNAFYEQLKKKVDYVIAISEYTRQTVIEKLKIPSENVFSIGISVQSRLTILPSAVSIPILKKYQLENKLYCLYPANFWFHKNHKMLLTAFNLFLKQYPQHELHLVLTGAQVENNRILTDSIKQMGIEERVHFTGYLPEDELSVIWQYAHFLIFPSLFEGFGIPLVEAMNYKKPVLASNVTSIPEVAGDAALYFNPKKPDEISDCIYRIITDKNLYEDLVEKGQEQLKKYNFEEMVHTYMKILLQTGERSKKTRTIKQILKL